MTILTSLFSAHRRHYHCILYIPTQVNLVILVPLLTANGLLLVENCGKEAMVVNLVQVEEVAIKVVEEEEPHQV